MNLLLGVIVQILHTVLLAVAAPTLVGALNWIRSRLARRAGPSLLQPWRELLRLLAKQTVVAESASTLTDLAPLISIAATAVAACLVPSFALGMTFAASNDLLVIGGLLALAHCSVALAAMDPGTAVGGIGASRMLLLACLSEATLMLVAFTLALLAGSTNIDLIAAMQIDLGTHWRSSAIMAFGAVLPVALADAAMPHGEAATEFSGPDLALIQASAALRLLVWFNLVGALFLPFGMAPAGAGPVAWSIGLACWLVRTVAFAVILVLLRATLGRIRLPRMVQMLGVSVLLGLISAILLLADMGAA